MKVAKKKLTTTDAYKAKKAKQRELEWKPQTDMKNIGALTFAHSHPKTKAISVNFNKSPKHYNFWWFWMASNWIFKTKIHIWVLCYNPAAKLEISFLRTQSKNKCLKIEQRRKAKRDSIHTTLRRTTTKNMRKCIW